MTPPALDWRSVERKLTRMRLLLEQLASGVVEDERGAARSANDFDGGAVRGRRAHGADRTTDKLICQDG